MNDDNLHSYILTEPTGNQSTPEANLVRTLLALTDYLLKGSFSIGKMVSPFAWGRPCPNCSDLVFEHLESRIDNQLVHSCGKKLTKVLIHGSSWNYKEV